MADPANKRKNIPKSVRFEVLKRDKFACQYCGASAPDVLLQIDHIDPVANAGDNDILNLVTSCAACNSGKSDRTLSDDTAIKKRKLQLDDLQERREQLEMMMEWKRGLRDLTSDTVVELCNYWNDLAPGYIVSEAGKRKIRTWSRSLTVTEITHAMDVAADQYLVFESTGNASSKSWELAFGKIPGICRVEKDPNLKELFYIRGILRNRLTGYFDEGEAMKLLEIAKSWGVENNQLKLVARNVRSWTGFQHDINTMVRSTPLWKQQQESTPESH